MATDPSFVDASILGEMFVIEYGYRDNGSGALSANGLNAKYVTGPSSFITYCIGISPYNDVDRSKTDIGDVLLYDSDSLTDNEASNNVVQQFVEQMGL